MNKRAENPQISVIIPTYNRANYLVHSLESLTRQSLPPSQFEVIVVDDGSSDNTGEVCRTFENKIDLRYFRIANSGIAAAKNLGIFVSRAPLLLFFDDDDVADPQLLAEHLRTHREHPEENVAVLGYTTWHPDLQVTPLMHYLTEVGMFLFAYPVLKDGQVLNFTYFWGGRSSCKRSLLVKHGIFDPRFRFGSEDIELGYRLSRFGFRVVYNRQAVSYMIRPLDFEQFCSRSERQGRSQYHFSKLHPDPLIQKYCQVERAEEKWRYIEPLFEKRKRRVRQLEKSLFRKHPKQMPPERLTELFQLYWWVFNASKIKGIVEEKRASEPSQEVHPVPSPLPSREFSTFQAKWRNVSLPPEQERNLLVVDAFLPLFDRASGSLRLFRLLQIFRELGFRITYIARNRMEFEKYGVLLQRMGIEVYAGDPEALDAAGMVQIQPYLDLKKILTNRRYQYAILSFWDVAEFYLPRIRRYSPHTRIIVDTVDIHFLRELREAALKRDPRKEQQALARKKRELAVYRQADRLWVVTEADRQAIADLVGGVPIDIIPNIHEKVPFQKTYRETRDLLFVGNFNHRPNVDAVEFLVQEIFPRIKKELPGVKLYLVGNNPPQQVRALQSQDVVVTGYVPDLTPYLKSARVSVSPLRYGAGMKGKVGEALSWGLPVVTTTIGAEGMNLVHEEHALIADDAETFAREVVRVYQDETLWKKLSESGRRLVEALWTPEAVREKLARILSAQETERPVESQEPLVSIVMLTYNALEFTRQCVQSLQEHTRLPYEIIFVDNGSRDGTVQYLRKLVKQRRHYQLIENKENRGFSAGNNQGAKVARGKYLLFLNNDVLVSDGWLESLVAALEADERIAMVGPITNSISGRQMVAEVPYREVKDFPRFAARVRELNRGKITPRRRLAGFALLVRKSVFQEVGGFDESFGTGNFEDDDLCLRVRQKGYALMVDESTFIHHFGSQTFKANKMDYLGSLEEKGEKFREKWPEVDYQELLEIKNPLDQLHPRLLEQANKRIVAGEYQEAAELFEQVLKENPLSGEALYGAALCARGRGNNAGALEYLNRFIRLFPDDAVALNQIGIVMAENGELETAKTFFAQAIQKDPTFLDAQRNYGEILLASGEYDYGVQAFFRILENHPDDVPTLLRVARLYIEAGRKEEARPYVQKAREIDPDYPEINILLEQVESDGNGKPEQAVPPTSEQPLYEEALSALDNGDSEKAIRLLQQVLTENPADIPARYALGLALQLTGQPEKAEQVFRQVIEQAPRFAPAYTSLGQLALQQGKVDLALEQFYRAVELDTSDSQAKVNLAEALIRRGLYQEAVQVLFDSLKQNPRDVFTLLKLGEIHWEAGRREDAHTYFSRVLTLEPENQIAREYLTLLTAAQN